MKNKSKEDDTWIVLLLHDHFSPLVAWFLIEKTANTALTRKTNLSKEILTHRKYPDIQFPKLRTKGNVQAVDRWSLG